MAPDTMEPCADCGERFAYPSGRAGCASSFDGDHHPRFRYPGADPARGWPFSHPCDNPDHAGAGLSRAL